MQDKRRRLKRLEKAILQTVAPLVSYGLRDPRLHMVTVTRVRLAADLSVAHVSWSLIGNAAERSKVQHALEDARGVLQGKVAENIQTRVTPHLEFHFDSSLERAARVNEIFDEIAKERQERSPPREDGEGDGGGGDASAS